MELKPKIYFEINKNHKEDESENLIINTNKFIKKITDNLNSFSYNVVIANMYEIYTLLNKDLEISYTTKTLIEQYKKILISISPILPHFSNECLSLINENKDNKWPEYNIQLLQEKETQIVIQINGKKRGLISIKKDTEENVIYDLVLKEESITKYLLEKEIQKKIYVKNRLVNLIV